MYKLINSYNEKTNLYVFSAVLKYSDIELVIPFAPDNTDYANFKKEILADEAQLQDAEGVLMTPEEAKAYVASLP